jgi:hypothetical protein
MVNPRAGHFTFTAWQWYGGWASVLAILLGWPIALPVSFAVDWLRDSKVISFEVGVVAICLAGIVGTYVHFKIWAFLWAALKAWWIKLGA